MTITITINAADVPSLQRMCAELAHSGAPPAAVAAIAETAQAVDYVTKDPVARDAAIQMGESRTANKKSKKSTASANELPVSVDKPAEAMHSAVSPPVETTKASAGAPLTIDNLRDKLRELSAAKGLPAVTEILKGFGVNRVSDAKADQYGAIIAKVDAALSQS